VEKMVSDGRFGINYELKKNYELMNS